VPNKVYENKTLKQTVITTKNKGIFGSFIKGKMECPVTVELPKSVYLAGERIECRITCDNTNMSKNIEKVKFYVNH
jgi:hypothetical protein